MAAHNDLVQTPADDLTQASTQERLRLVGRWPA